MTISQSIYNLPTYRFRGAYILFEPAPDFSLANAIELEYVRSPNILSGSSDIDSQFAALASAEDCVVIACAIKCKQIDESISQGSEDTSTLLIDLAKTEEMLKEVLTQRSMGRQYVEQWGEMDNDSIQTWSL
ncbi:hypothetical protein CCP1ISM_50001 [Azospirillaceae bacterium]